MPREDRRTLTEEEKQQLLVKHTRCYICDEPLAGYSREEIEFDHIYNYADGYPQDLSNFAPVHSSDDNRKLNCHLEKGKKAPIEYREEKRVEKRLHNIKGLADLCPKAITSVYTISDDHSRISFNGVALPLYNQKIGGRDNFYFFHEIETKYIENDAEIQLRPLEPKILPLIFNLKTSVQLLPSLARLDPINRTVKIFDGQHKAVAQLIGNNKDRISCIVFVDPDVDALRVTVFEAHTDFVQQRYKKSHIDAKLAAIYNQKIEAFRRRVGNTEAQYSEADILQGESTATIRQFLLSAILNEVGAQSDFIRLHAAEGRPDQKQKPILWQSLERLVTKFCNLAVVEELSEGGNNFREEEVENLTYILTLIEEYAIKGKWNPENSASKEHKMARTFFYRTAFNNWSTTLEEGFRFTLAQMRGAKVWGPICYQSAFPADVRKRYSDITKRLFEHPLWVQEAIQDEIAKTNQDAVVADIFKREGLDYIFITKL